MFSSLETDYGLRTYAWEIKICSWLSATFGVYLQLPSDGYSTEQNKTILTYKTKTHVNMQAQADKMTEGQLRDLDLNTWPYSPICMLHSSIILNTLNIFYASTY